MKDLVTGKTSFI